MNTRVLKAIFFACLLLSRLAFSADKAGGRIVDLRIDVTSALHLPGISEVAATVFLPDPKRLPARPVAIFALPGAGLSRHYFDIQLPGREGYSEAQYHVAEGLVFVAVDHLGVGDSSTAGQDTLRIEDIAQADDAAVREIARRIEQGTLAPGFPALPKVYKVGIGQSMGGGVTIIMQGRHATYDAIGVMGFSAIRGVLPQPTEAGKLRVMKSMSKSARWTAPQDLSFKTTADAKPDMAYFSFWDDVPQDIIDAKYKSGWPTSTNGPNWLSHTAPRCAVAMTSPAYLAAEAAQIEVPVLLLFGERDSAQNPLAEPAVYQLATDISVTIIPNSAHTHNLASSRQKLWRRIADWSRLEAAAH